MKRRREYEGEGKDAQIDSIGRVDGVKGMEVGG